MLIKEKLIQKISGPLLLVYWIALAIGTHIPDPDIPDLPDNSDKVMHFVAYAGLCFFFCLWKSSQGPLSRSDLLKITGIIAIYATIDELLQIPFNRFCDPLDALADWAGIVIGLLIFYLWDGLGTRLIVRKEG